MAARSRPVVLATLGVPFDADAAAFAVDTAVEAAEPLVVVNAVELLLAPCSLGLGYGEPEEPEDAEALAVPASVAASLGVRVERLRIRSPHPVDALIEVAAERGAGLLVFGPDRARLPRRRYLRAAKTIRERVACLVWLPD
jgi:nucleotide-binding universal stress UspA family protein